MKFMTLSCAVGSASKKRLKISASLLDVGNAPSFSCFSSSLCSPYLKEISIGLYLAKEDLLDFWYAYEGRRSGLAVGFLSTPRAESGPGRGFVPALLCHPPPHRSLKRKIC